MKKLLLVVIALFLMSGISSAEQVTATQGVLKIENVLEAKLESAPKTIIYRKHKNGESTIYIKFEKVEP
jgi:uncharacterized protein YcfL